MVRGDRSARAAESDEFAFLNREVDVAEDGLAAVALADTAEFEEGHGGEKG